MVKEKKNFDSLLMSQFRNSQFDSEMHPILIIIVNNNNDRMMIMLISPEQMMKWSRWEEQKSHSFAKIAILAKHVDIFKSSMPNFLNDQLNASNKLDRVINASNKFAAIGWSFMEDIHPKVKQLSTLNRETVLHFEFKTWNCYFLNQRHEIFQIYPNKKKLRNFNIDLNAFDNLISKRPPVTISCMIAIERYSSIILNESSIL